MLLLDGLDEIQSPFFFIALRKIIEFGSKRPEIRMVVSCRTNFYELPTATFSGTLEGFSVFTLNDISLGEIRHYATTPLQLDGQEFIKDVYEASFLDLIQKPYFLDLLTRHYTQSGSFPANRTLIFEEALLNYYNKDKEHFKTTGQLLSKPETFLLLEKVAFIMEVMGKNFITDEELLKLFPQQHDFGKCRYMPAFKRNDKTGQWMFEHNNIQEFLAARMLSQKPFDKLIEIISLSAAGAKKIKHTWVNTLSFFISIDKTDKSDKLLEWIAENDVEVIIRFEPDRISDQKRIAVFKQIFEYYSTKQIWLTSNKFSDSDLAKFGWFDEVIEYLIERIKNPEYSRITKLNAIRLLDNYNLSIFAKYAVSTKQSLLSLLEAEGMNDYDVYAILGALANLELTDAETIEYVISKFRRHKNQYIRAGLYKLLHLSSLLEDHLDIIIEGLDLKKIENPVENRESVNLMDESLHLETALKQVKSPQGLKKILALFSNEKNKYLFFSEHKDVLPAIINNSVNAYTYDPSIYEYLMKYFIISENLYNTEYLRKILRFFERTNTKWKVFTDIWKNKTLPDYDRWQLLEVLLTDETIQQFNDSYINGEFPHADAEMLHQLLFWNVRNHPGYENYLQLLETTSQKFFGITLMRPVLKDWSLINKKRTQDAFDLLFDKQALFQEVESIFSVIKIDEIVMTDLFDYRSKHNESLEHRHIESAIELIRYFTYHGRMVTLNNIRQFISSDTEFVDYQIASIYNKLHGSNNREIEVTDAQLKFITTWCVEKGNNDKILLFFIHLFTIRLEKSRLLDLTLYYDYNRESKLDEPGTIEQLELFLPRRELKAKVTVNLEAGIKNSMSWLSNAGYAIRHNIKQAYPGILRHLESVDDDQYKFSEILEFWFKKTGDTKRISELIENTSSEYLQWRAIMLLGNSGKEQTFLNGYLKRVMNDEAKDRAYRLTAANYLMLMNDLEGLHFCAKEILDNPDPKFDFRHDLNNMSRLKDARAIPELMKLLYLGKQPEHQLDRFNSLESVVTDTLYNIGIESDTNFI